MKKTQKLHAALSVLLAVAMTVPMVFNGDGVEAAKKPKLSASKMTVYSGSSKTLKVKNFTKKVTWKTSKASVAKLSAKKKTSVKVTGKKAGSAKVTATYKLAGKKKVLTCKVTVKNKNIVTAAPVDTASTAPAPTTLITQNPVVTPTPTVDPNAPTPTFDYDSYAECKWKTKDTLKDVFKDYFKVGVATGYGALTNGEFSSLIRYHYNSVSMDNATKMENFLRDTPTTPHPNGMESYNVDNYYNGDKTPVIDFESFENCLSYCKAHGLKMRFHTFVWHSQVQPWFFLKDYNWNTYTKEEYAANGWDVNNYHKLADKETMKTRLNSFITQIIDYVYSHGYGDVIYAYDVINEATNGNLSIEYDENKTSAEADDMAKLSSGGNTYSNGVYSIKINGGVSTSKGVGVTSGSSPEDVEDMCSFEGRTPNNSHSYWYSTMGYNYLYYAYSDAYIAVKDGLAKYKDKYNYTTIPSLLYNDYSSGATKTEIGLVKWINAACNKANGTTGVVYCNGIGIQSHDVIGSNDDAMIKTYVDAGMEVQITELDVGCNTGNGWNYDGQASTYKSLYKTYMKYSGNGEYCKGKNLTGVTSVTQWGIRDGDSSWRSNDNPYCYQDYTDDNNPAGETKDEKEGLLRIQPKPAFYAILQAGGVSCGDKEY